MLSLNELLECLYTDYNDQFQSIVGENPTPFWDGVRADDPRLSVMTDITQNKGWQDTTYPLM